MSEGVTFYISLVKLKTILKLKLLNMFLDVRRPSFYGTDTGKVLMCLI